MYTPKRTIGGLGGAFGPPVPPFNANERQVGGSHYKGVKYQHWDLCWDLHMEHLPSAITKYVTRHDKKLGKEDLEKALHYAEKYQEVIDRVATPFPRHFDQEVEGGFHQVYTAETAAYVQLLVTHYCAANALEARESAIIGLLCHPHDETTLYEVQELIRSLLVDRYNVPYAEAFPGRPAPSHGYSPDSDDTEDRGYGAIHSGEARAEYVNQDPGGCTVADQAAQNRRLPSHQPAG